MKPENHHRYEHLNSRTGDIADGTDAERIWAIKSGVWIGYNRAKEIIAHMEDLMNHPQIERMPHMLLVGESNNGKTVILERFAEMYPMDPNPDGDHIICPVVRVSVPGTSDVDGLCRRILDSVNAPYRETAKPSARIDAVVSVLSGIGTRILLIDEIQDMMTSGRAKQWEFRNAIKAIGNGLKRSIVTAGIDTARVVFATDPQLSNRFELEELPRWEMNSDLGRLLMSFERNLPLRRASGLHMPELMQKILWMSEGLIGEIHSVIKKASEQAIKTKQECITPELLASIRWRKPSERR